MDAKEASDILEVMRSSICPMGGIDALDLAIAALEREHAERWRSVEEEVPEEMALVLITKDGIVSAAQFSGDEWYLNGGIAPKDWPLAWRPMPAPAKEETRG